MIVKFILMSLGAHIGERNCNLNSFFKPFLVGIRGGYSIFHIDCIVYYFLVVNRFFFSLGKQNCKFLFYYHSFFSRDLFRFFFFTKLNSTGNFFIDERWRPGILSNAFYQCRSLFEDLFFFGLSSKTHRLKEVPKKKISFFQFFVHLLFLSFKNHLAGTRYVQTFQRFFKYWRFFLFFKFFYHFNVYPDALFYLTHTNYVIPVRESNNLKIPVVCVLDSNFSFFYRVTYPLIGNSKSIFLHLFYFQCFLTSYKRGLNSLYFSFHK